MPLRGGGRGRWHEPDRVLSGAPAFTVKGALTLPRKLRTPASGNFQPFQLGFGRLKVGSPDVVEIADRTDIRRASSRGASTRRVCSEAALADPPSPLADV